MKKIVLVTVDFDLPVISVQTMGEDEREELDDNIELDGGKEVNTFDQFLDEVGVHVDFVNEMNDMSVFVKGMLTSYEVCESYTFASGELGHGFYVVVNDNKDQLAVDLFKDFV